MSKLTDLCKQFAQFKKDHKAAEDKAKEINQGWLLCEEQLLEAMVEEGTNSVDLDGLGKFSLKTTNYLNVNAANKPGFFIYLKESGNGGLLKEDVNPKTLTSFLSQHLTELISAIIIKDKVDEVTARDKALELLKGKGANYFTKREISLRGAKNGESED